MIGKANETKGDRGASSESILNRFRNLLADRNLFPNASDRQYRDALNQIQLALKLVGGGKSSSQGLSR